MFQTLDSFAGRWGLAGTVQPHAGGLEQGFDGQRGFAAARNTRHTNELAQRKFRRHLFQIVARGLDHGDFLFVARTPFGGDCDLL